MILISTILLFSIFAQSVLAQPPVHWWKFKEGVGDFIANENPPPDCLRQGFTNGWTTGVNDFALIYNYNGIDDWVDCTNHPALDFSSQLYTIKVWVIGERGFCEEGETIYHKMTPVEPFPEWSVGYWLFLLGDCTPFWWSDDGSGAVWLTPSGTVNVMDGAWHMITISRDGEHFEMWIDTDMVDYTDGGYSGSENNPDILSLGSIDGFGMFYYESVIDEIEIFDYPFFEPDVIDNYISFMDCVPSWEIVDISEAQ